MPVLGMWAIDYFRFSELHVCALPQLHTIGFKRFMRNVVFGSGVSHDVVDVTLVRLLILSPMTFS